MRPPSPPPPDRLLVCGPVFPSGTVGGLPFALDELARALTTLGWSVDLAITPETLGQRSGGRAPVVVPRWLGRRWTGTPRLGFLPASMRTLLQHMLLGGGVARSQSEAVRAIEERLANGRYAAVVAHVYKASPGFARFITSRHPAVLLHSLDGLASELSLARWLWLPRLVARIAPGHLHPDLYHPVDPEQIRTAVFASEAWRADAVAAGLSEHAARVIPFGIAVPEPLQDLPESQGRLLWVGRCSPEKGLHLFLDALATLRRTRRVTLTAVTAQGPDRYRQKIERQLHRLGLNDIVRLMPAVPRADLAHFYASHDALLFHSSFREPMALVLMEAFSAGIPVVAPRPTASSALVDPDTTCVCFETSTPAAVADATSRALDDVALRQRVRTLAHARIQSTFTIGAMAKAFDAELRALCTNATHDAST